MSSQLRQRASTRAASLSSRFALGPILWPFIAGAESRDIHEQTAWDRGVAHAAAGIDNNRGAFAPLVVVLGGLVGPLASAPGPLVLRSVLGAAIGLGLLWFIPTAWAAIVALGAPRRQRDEARKAFRDKRKEAEKRLAAERARFNEMDATWREAMERTQEEREDLRGKLGQAETEIRGLRARGATLESEVPSSVFDANHSHFDLDRLWQIPPKDVRERLLVVDLDFTNRQRGNRVRLNVDLMWQLRLGGKEMGRPLPFLHYFQDVGHNQLHPPLDVGAQEGIKGPLVFRVTGEESFLRFADNGDVFVMPRTVISVRLTDLVSGDVLDIPLDVPQWEERETSA
jgi:hypothetical protein